MNVRQQLYKKHRLEGMSKYAAARKAGYSHSYAIQAKSIENRINIEQYAEMAGLTDKKLIDYIVERLQAQKVISADIFIRDENGKLTVNKNSNDWIEYPDYHAQHKFLETFLKVIGKIKSGNTQVIQQITTSTNGKLTDGDRRKQTEFVGRLEHYFGNGKD